MPDTVRDRVMTGGGGRGGGKVKGLCGHLTGSPICRGFESVILRLRGRGYSIHYASQDGPIHIQSAGFYPILQAQKLNSFGEHFLKIKAGLRIF